MSRFDDLLDANKAFADSFALAGFDGIAKAGVAVVTCMDSRIDPLGMIGLTPGDAKILRNPGGRVTDQVLVALVIGTSMLEVRRVMVVQHTRCAMAISEDEVHDKVDEFSGNDSSWMSFGVIGDQHAAVLADVKKITSHPLIPWDLEVGGFLYDVDTGLLDQIV